MPAFAHCSGHHGRRRGSTFQSLGRLRPHTELLKACRALFSLPSSNGRGGYTNYLPTFLLGRSRVGVPYSRANYSAPIDACTELLVGLPQRSVLYVKGARKLGQEK